MPYTLPAQERGEKRAPDGYQLIRICTDGRINVASMQNGVIKQGNKPVMTAFACIDEGPLAGHCVAFSRTLIPESLWSLKNALRATKTDDGIPENTEYTFKNDADILDRVHRMSGPALVTQREIGENTVSMLDYFFVNDEEAGQYEDAQPITEKETEDISL